MKTKGNTLIEILVAMATSVILMLMVYNFYATTHAIYTSGMTSTNIQEATRIIISKIIEGKTEPTGVFRLQEATLYNIPSIAELHWWGPDDVERWYKLSADSTQLIYHHPTSSGTVDEVLYKAPEGAAITLRFWVPNVANYSASVVGIDVALTQTILGKAVSGASSTIVNLRNHPV